MSKTIKLHIIEADDHDVKYHLCIGRDSFAGRYLCGTDFQRNLERLFRETFGEYEPKTSWRGETVKSTSEANAALDTFMMAVAIAHNDKSYSDRNNLLVRLH